MKNRHGKLENSFSHRMQMKINMFGNLQGVCSQFKLISSLYEGKKIQLCLTKHLLNMFNKLRCE